MNHRAMPWPLTAWRLGGIALLLFSLVTAQVLAAALPDFTQLIAQNKDAVVSINATRKSGDRADAIPHNPQVPDMFKHFFEQFPDRQPTPNARSAGSGFIISADGYVLTNAHVVANTEQVTVTLNDRSEFPAKLIGADENTDLALLKVNADGLPTVKLGDSEQLKVGQWVFAIGAPFGFQHSATQGVISALSRSLPDGTYVPFIQTDVAVNPGNSGGPLFDLDGNVIGINSQIYSRSGGYMGLSFAIPVNVAKNIVEQLKTNGYASHGWLGVLIQDMNQALAQSFGLDKPAGALVAQVTPDSPAAKAGLRAGDVIVNYNGKRINRSGDLPPLVGATATGSQVPVDILREGKKMSMTLTIGELENKSERLSMNRSDAATADSPLGLAVEQLNDAERKELGVANGVLVAGVDPEGVAAAAGIRPRDVILSFNQQPVKNAAQLKQLISAAPKGKPAAVQIQRQQQALFVAVPIPTGKVG
ncbi:MAG: DegQ family serine endoprotease [Candidatus Competibacteraceae bacterium]|nr:DegQ family serine endoprotease [Candidatus Competibacteraceae bacterium]